VESTTMGDPNMGGLHNKQQTNESRIDSDTILEIGRLIFNYK
jgi:hypothetical protein